MLNVSGHNIGLGKKTRYDNKARATLVIRKNVENCGGGWMFANPQTLDREDSPLAIFVPCIALPRNPRRRKKQSKETNQDSIENIAQDNFLHP